VGRGTAARRNHISTLERAQGLLANNYRGISVILDQLTIPIVLAPLAGGPSTPQLTAAVSNAGGLGFLAAGYLTGEGLAERLAQTGELTSAPIGVNVFVPGSPAAPGVAEAYEATLADDAREAGVGLGRARFDDDDWATKIDLLVEAAPPVVSFTFGCPDRAVTDRLHRVGSEVWVTVTTPGEARHAVGLAADALVVQGVEAGGHRGSFRDDPAQAGDGLGLLSLLQLVQAAADVPLVAAGGISTGAGVAAVLAAGAAAAQIGTAFMRCPEAGTAGVQRDALGGTEPTALTRAFTGRLARGIRNRFLDLHTAGAPVAYPEVHHLTAPLRAAARARRDPGLVNLWAGQSYQLGTEMPAGELARALAGQARDAFRRGAKRLAI
jgi:nitronate monooxygenase